MRRLPTFRITLLALGCLLLGLATTVSFAIALAWVRAPVNSFRGTTVDMGRPAQPFVTGTARIGTTSGAGGYKIIAYWWTFDDQRCFGERTLAWMSTISPEELPKPWPGRPSVCTPIDAFFGHEYLANPKDRTLDRYSINVARTYGWPLQCLWEGETVDGMNSGLTHWPWNGFSYGGVKIGTAGPLSHYIPTLPLWPGLITDTLLFAAVWLTIGFCVRRIRQARLRGRQLCLHCGYDLSATPPNSPCPECGRSNGSVTTL